MCCPWPAALDPALQSDDPRWRSAVDGGSLSFGGSVWPVWLSSGDGFAGNRGLAGEPQADSADLATRGAEGPMKATEGESRSPNSGDRMAAEEIPFPWRWKGGTIFLNLGVIWKMSVKPYEQRTRK